jgi:hypothetical protein
MRRLELSYVLPLRWTLGEGLAEMTVYLKWLSEVAEVIVVDGSDNEVFARHAKHWGPFVAHMRPDPDLRFTMGKVNGVTTGVRRASFEWVVIADDDVRYRRAELERVATLLKDHDVVRPQNYFDPTPWHARWDTARTLLNRAFARDFPGTLGVRRSTFLTMDGYDGNVMFENLELIRTVIAAGGSEAAPLDLYVRRIPPDATLFLSQRVRQAYDDFALPARMAAWLALGPTVAWLAATGRKKVLAALTLGAIGCAEVGRRKAGGTRYFPAASSWFTPVWLAERALCAWPALWQRIVRGGVSYRGGVVPKAANSKRELALRVGGGVEIRSEGAAHSEP